MKTLSFNDLGRLVRERRERDGLSLRRAADKARVSFNTLARVEAGHIPELSTFERIAVWLGIPLEQFVVPPKRSTTPTPEVIAHHLRSDPDLSREAAEKISSIVKDLYSALVQPSAKGVAVHLRAARTFHPDAARILSGLLQQMSDKLRSEEGVA